MRTLEITTRIGCFDCRFCPQDVLLKAYGHRRPKLMAHNIFLRAINTLPKDMRIDFSGMGEPFLNPYAVDMVKIAHDEGYKIAVFTTCVGLSVENIESLSHIPFETFEIHTNDRKGYSHIPTSPQIDSAIREAKKRLKNVVVSNHERIRIISRAGNVKGIEAPYHKGTIRCSRGLERFVMLPDGTLILCCMDYGMKHVIGNILKQSYADIASGDPFKTVKENMLNGKEVLCRHCEMAIPSKEL